MGNREAKEKKWQRLDSWAGPFFLKAVEWGRQPDLPWIGLSARAIFRKSPGRVPSTKFQSENRWRWSETEPRQARSRVSSAPPPGCDSRRKIGARANGQQVEVVPTRKFSLASLHRHRSHKLRSRASAISVASELGRMGPVAIVRCAQTAGPGQDQPTVSFCGNGNWRVELLDRSSELDQTGPRGRGTHIGLIGLNRPKARRIDDHAGLNA